MSPSCTSSNSYRYGFRSRPWSQDPCRVSAHYSSSSCMRDWQIVVWSQSCPKIAHMSIVLCGKRNVKYQTHMYGELYIKTYKGACSVTRLRQSRRRLKGFKSLLGLCLDTLVFSPNKALVEI